MRKRPFATRLAAIAGVGLAVRLVYSLVVMGDRTPAGDGREVPLLAKRAPPPGPAPPPVPDRARSDGPLPPAVPAPLPPPHRPDDGEAAAVPGRARAAVVARPRLV